MRIINCNLEKIGIYIRKSRGIPKAKKRSDANVFVCLSFFKQQCVVRPKVVWLD